MTVILFTYQGRRETLGEHHEGRVSPLGYREKCSLITQHWEVQR